ncbi:MAG: histidine phosphatase family protein [Acidimicrobiales bacterium]
MGSQLLVIRHGQTEWSAAGRHTGLTDIALTEQGRGEALAAANTLADWSVDHVYSSPLRRARETAELVGLKLLKVVALPWQRRPLVFSAGTEKTA